MPLWLCHIIMYIALSLATVCVAQPPDTLWTSRWDMGGAEEYVNSISPTFDGGFVLTGQTDVIEDGYACWVCRVDASGGTTWSRLYGGGDREKGIYAEQTSDSGFVVCGSSRSFGPYPSYGSYVMKLNQDGDVLWHRIYSADGYDDHASCVREMPNHDLVVGGVHEGLPYLARLSGSGQPVWFNTYEIPDGIYFDIQFVEPTSDDGCVAGGRYYPDTHTRATLWKTDAEGALEWIADSLDMAKVTCVRQTEDGHYVTSGFQNLFDGNGVNRQAAEYDENGELIWERRYMGEGSTDRATSIFITQDGQLLIAGYYWVWNYLNYNQWVAKVERDGGDIIWETSVQQGRPLGMSISRDGGIAYAGGDEFGSGQAWSSDFVMVKLAPEVTVSLTSDADPIPSTGGMLIFDELLANILVAPTDLDRWTLILGPNDFREVGEVSVFTLQPGSTTTNPNQSFDIPASWADGSYTVELHYGSYPGDMANMGLGTLSFEKGGSGASELEHANQPSIFKLSNAWPNPFNASTNFTLTLPGSAPVTITVCNVEGRVVSQLADNTHLPAGTYEFTFDASGLASGPYFIRAMIPDQLDQVQKVILVH